MGQKRKYIGSKQTILRLETLDIALKIVLNVLINLNTVVSNLVHSVKIFLFSPTTSCDFDGLIGIELPVAMHATQTPICAVLAFDPRPKKALHFL